MFELNQLRGFIAVATELSFRRAAKRLNMTQPPLSRQIQMLEHEIGAELFDRTGRSIRLTAAGSCFLGEAQDILRRAEIAALSAKRTDLGGEGSVALGFLPFSALCLLPSVVTLLDDAFPAVDIVLKEMSTVDQFEALSTGSIDLGIVRMPRDRSRMHLARLHREPYLLAMHCDHELMQKNCHSIHDLHHQDLLMHTPSDCCHGYDSLEGLLSANQVRPKSTQCFSRTVTILSIINAGGGVALVPASARNLGFRNVVLRSVDLSSPIQSEHFLVWSNTRVEMPVAQRVRRKLVAAFQQAGKADHPSLHHHIPLRAPERPLIPEAC